MNQESTEYLQTAIDLLQEALVELNKWSESHVGSNETIAGFTYETLRDAVEKLYYIQDEEYAEHYNTFQRIEAELLRQDKKWGGKRVLPLTTWATVLGEEYGEVCRAILETKQVDYVDELTQVAAVAIQAIESIQRSTSWSSDQKK